jgi:hypothetical protein
MLLGPTAIAGEYEDGLQAYKARRFADAISIWTPLAEKGDKNSQFHLGMMARSGEGRGFNIQEAVKWLELAAKQGHPEAAFQLGRIHEDGQGVKIDRPLAAQFYEMAGSKAHAEALWRLSTIYSKGLGVTKDERRAETIVRAAAEAGSGTAQTVHALNLAKRSNDSENLILAYAWFTVAAENQPLDQPKEKEAVLFFRSLYTGKLGFWQRMRGEKLAAELLQKHPRFKSDYK